MAMSEKNEIAGRHDTRRLLPRIANVSTPWLGTRGQRQADVLKSQALLSGAQLGKPVRRVRIRPRVVFHFGILK
jgi:hypothetical protein